MQSGFTFLMPAYPGCPGKEAVKRVSSLTGTSQQPASSDLAAMTNDDIKHLDPGLHSAY